MAPPAVPDTPIAGTLVSHPRVHIEDDLPRSRVRRPTDPLRLLGALTLSAAAVSVGVLAAQTSEGLDRDVVSATRELPALLLIALNLVGAGAVFLLPAAIAVVLVVRGRTSQLFESLLGALLAAGLAIGLGLLVTQGGSGRLTLALTGVPGAEATTAINPLLASLVAFITVSRMIKLPPWNAISVLTVAALSGAILTAGGTSVLALVAAVGLGWASGLAVRYALGTPSTMPSARAVAEALTASGIAVTSLTALAVVPEGRRYLARGPTGDLDVTVLDREREGAGLVTAVLTSRYLRVDGRTGFGIRRRVEHDTALLLAAAASGARVPQLRLARELGSEAALLVIDRPRGQRLDELTAPLTAGGPPCPVSGPAADAIVTDALTQVMALQRAGIAHRGLTAHNLLLVNPENINPGTMTARESAPDREGQTDPESPPAALLLLGVQDGVLAASDLTLRIDLAEALITLSGIAGAERTVAAAHAICGREALVRALPALQPVAMTGATRDLLRRCPHLLGQLRTHLTELVQVASVPALSLQRIRPRTLVFLAASLLGLYVIVPQLTRIDPGDLIASAQPQWAVIALGFSALTYVAAASCVLAFVLIKVSYLRALLVQFAASFVLLFSPPTVGTVAVNVRFLQRSGLPAPVAGTTVIISQLMSFLAHGLLLGVVVLIAGTQAELSVNPPRFALIGAAGALILIGVVLTLPVVRRRALERLRPAFSQVGPALATIAGQPARLLIGLTAGLALNTCYVSALYASVRAFDGELSLTAVAFVYLAGIVLGQIAPTPGGLGAVEAALAAGLTAVGLDGATAISSVLLFRLVTFWLPVLPGWGSLLWLQRRSAL